MKILKKKKTDNAVVGVVTAILIVGLIVAVVSLVQTMYIPKIMEEREADHMDKVAEQFTYLTSVIDGQAANPNNTMPIAVSITLGSKELPYMLSMKAFGTLEILDTTSSIEITGNPSRTFSLGRITYSSMNAYFINQNYTYEAGAMIVSQYEGSEDRNYMMIPPSFFVVDSSNIHFDIVNIVSVGHKTIASGFGTYPILTKLDSISSDSNESTITGVSNIKINTPNTNAWSIFMRSSLNQATVTSVNEQYVNVHFDNPVTVVYKKIVVNAQIGPGWIEQ